MSGDARFLFADERRDQQQTAFTRVGGLDGDLDCVFREIVELTGADGAILTMHPRDLPPTIVYVERQLREAGLDDACLEVFRVIDRPFVDGVGVWRSLADGGDLFLMPVQRTPGHSLLVIGVFFKRTDGKHREAVEQLYRERRPLAIGFFRLWQQNRVLQQRASALEAVLDRTAIGVILIARSGQIVFANETADEILAKADGLGRVGQYLRATHLADGVHLHAAFSHAMAGIEQEGGAASLRAPMLAFRRQRGHPLVASILAGAHLPIEANDVAAIMYVVDPNIDTEAALSPLCRLYGLSQVETSLVCHLASGETLAGAARAIHVKEQTARGYLKAIFIKTGTKRQLDLIVMMLSSLLRMKRGVKHEEILFKR